MGPTVSLLQRFRQLCFSKSQDKKMPKGGGRAASGAGTNSSGNSYTRYSKSGGSGGSGGGKPAGYSYSNANGSSYYNNGAGHGFYRSPSDGTKSSGGQAYSTHYNYNAGTASSKNK